MRSERRGNVEIRLNDDGTLDELFIFDPADPERVLLHMEQMSEASFWMRTGGTRDPLGERDCLVVNLLATTRRGKRVMWTSWEWD